MDWEDCEDCEDIFSKQQPARADRKAVGQWGAAAATDWELTESWADGQRSSALISLARPCQLVAGGPWECSVRPSEVVSEQNSPHTRTQEDNITIITITIITVITLT